MQINENYVADAPGPETAMRLFEGRWTSKVPGLEHLSGPAELFTDQRIQWWVDQNGGFDGRSILELGPLEGGHTQALLAAGAASVLGIEASTTAFLKSLIVKEILDLRNARFLLGDFDKFLETTDRRFDAVLACGVLYHMPDPLQTLQNIIRVTDEVFIWSHFIVPEAMPEGDARRRFFTGETSVRERNGELLTYHFQAYGEEIAPTGFVGGMMPRSAWVELAEVIWMFERNGYEVITHFRHDEHPNGPAAALRATRKR